ncbi:Cobalt-dependent inorganic pyrophosphatase [subsurface metagenome]
MSTSEHPLIVIGHKNPDTDSICSAAAYAHLKNDFLGQAATAFRAGNLNLQTSFVLSHFGVKSPDLITDVYPKIIDIMIKEEALITLKEEDSLAQAQNILIKNRFSFLPVVDSEGKFAGKITALRLAGLIREFGELAYRQSIFIDLEKFLKSAGGRMVTCNLKQTSFTGKLLINNISPGPRSEEPGSILFVSLFDEDALIEVVEKGVKCIIVCGLDSLGGKIPELAARNDVCLMVSPGDILSTVVNIFLAMPIRNFIDRQHPTFKQDDLVRNVQKEIGKYNEGGFIVIDEDNFIQGVITRINFLNQSRFRVVMVDHNEFSQGVEGIEEAEVVEIIDHHRLGNRNTDAPITFINKVVGSTCTIIAELYKISGFNPDPGIAGLMLPPFSRIRLSLNLLQPPNLTWICPGGWNVGQGSVLRNTVRLCLTQEAPWRVLIRSRLSNRTRRHTWRESGSSA